MTDSTKQPTVLYVYFGEFSNNYFESEKECNDYYEKSSDPFAYVGVIEYFSQFEGKDDVIKLTYREDNEYKECIISACDGVSYYAYQSNAYENSNDTSHWQNVVGTAEWMYVAFRNKGIIFKNDIYAKAREEQKKFVKILEQAI